jgi:large subunit ribosomal protein L3
MKAILGKKVGMTQIFDENGRAIPVTIVEAGPCKVVQVKTEDKEGYNAVQIGYGTKKHVNKPMAGHLKKWNVDNAAILKEIRFEGKPEYEAGAEIKVDLFQDVKYVDVVSNSKGRGFAGVVKKYNFAGGRATHGGRLSLRGTGSVGNCASPGRIMPGKRMPGRMGGKPVTVQNLEVVKVVPEANLLFIKGAIPGYKTAVVFVRESKKKK